MTADKFENWYRKHTVKPHRDYKSTIVPRIEALAARSGFKVEKYGEATYTTDNLSTGQVDSVTHDLYQILVGDFNPAKPTYIVIGGTHGYEKSGPQSALGFAEEEAADYAVNNNIIIYPCLCPGPYEKELRYTEGRIDPNRDAFAEGAKSEELRAFTAAFKELHQRFLGNGKKFTAAIDLHETPKMDIDISRESAELGLETFTLDDFPEGFFLIVRENDQDYGRHVVNHIKQEGHTIIETHEICGDKNDHGVVLMNGREDKPYVNNYVLAYTDHCTITEWSGMDITDDMSDDIRNAPQRAAIRGMLSYPAK